MMERLKLFISNFLIYGMGGVINKIIPMIMLPFVTRLMPNTEYFGLNDISTIIVQFGSSLAIMGMYDAMFRLFFDRDDKEYQRKICSSALAFTLVTSFIIFFTLLLCNKWLTVLFFSDEKYTTLLYISAISILIGATNSIVSAPTRITNKRTIYLLTNALSSVLSYSISIPLLLNGYYLIALPLAGLISAITLEIIFWGINKNWFSFKLINKNLIKEMLKIGLPLLPNFLIYWVFNSSDKLMIAKILGNDQAGIYAIGAKVGQISQLIYTAFAGGWQYFAFSTMKDNDQVKLTSRVMEYLSLITFLGSLLIVCFCNQIFSLFFTGDYIKGAIVAPYLFISPLLLMLFQVGSNQFLVIKKTWPNMFILLIGAISNIVLNFILIPLIGIEGAAIATLIGYILSVLICILVLQHINLLNLPARFWIVAIIGFSYFIFHRLIFDKNTIASFLILLLIYVVYLFFYREDLKKIIMLIKKR